MYKGHIETGGRTFYQIIKTQKNWIFWNPSWDKMQPGPLLRTSFNKSPSYMMETPYVGATKQQKIGFPDSFPIVFLRLSLQLGLELQVLGVHEKRIKDCSLWPDASRW